MNRPKPCARCRRESDRAGRERRCATCRVAWREFRQAALALVELQAEPARVLDHADAQGFQVSTSLDHAPALTPFERWIYLEVQTGALVLLRRGPDGKPYERRTWAG